MIQPMVLALPRALEELCTVSSMVREQPVGNVIPDIVIGCWDTSDVLARIRSLTRLECHVLALLHREGPLTVSDVASHGYLTERAAAKAVAVLTKQRLVIAGAHERVHVLADLRDVDLRVIAVEAKLRLWRRALTQAKTYRAFADAAYVVLDGNSVRVTNDLIANFAESGVGLLMQYGRIVTLASKADLRPPELTTDRVWAVRKLVERALS